ncbi:unnamed protein product [Closterium sp. Yama58-4]|nr:unnamed protein product [Closterium sp. Yama58-4]
MEDRIPPFPRGCQLHPIASSCKPSHSLYFHPSSPLSHLYAQWTIASPLSPGAANLMASSPPSNLASPLGGPRALPPLPPNHQPHSVTEADSHISSLGELGC